MERYINVQLSKIIKGCKDRDPRCQKELYNRFFGIMMAVCYRYCSCRQDAEDIVQEGFIKIFDKLEAFDYKGSFEGWMRRIMANTAIDSIRKSKKDPILTDNDEDFKLGYIVASSPDIKLFDNKVTVSSNVIFAYEETKNRPGAGYYNNPLTGLYLFARERDFNAYKTNYQVFDAARNINRMSWYSTEEKQNNPYWELNQNSKLQTSHRVIANVKLSYDIAKNLKFETRGNIDYNNMLRDNRWAAGGNSVSVSPNGTWSYTKYNDQALYADGIFTYNNNFGDLSLTALAGASYQKNTFNNGMNVGNGTIALMYPNFFTFANLPFNVVFNQTINRTIKQGAFANLQFGYKDMLFVDVSAVKVTGIDQLVEAILLTADAAIDLRAIHEDDARGVAIEAHLDRGRGPVATVLVQRGTLSVGDAIVAGSAFGRVRAMMDEFGKEVEVAGPSRPVQVLGFTSVPSAGDSFIVAPDDRTARQIAEKRQAGERHAALAKARKKVSLEDFLEQSKVTTLNLILKGDVSGSVEALEDALIQLDVGSEVDLRVIHRGVGAITKSDVTLASASGAVIVGFNVKPEAHTAIYADEEGVEVRFYSVIYKAIEEIEAALKGLLKPEYEEAVLGRAEVREVFKSSKFGTIAGSLVSTGLIRRNAKARVLRDNVVIGDNLTVESLKRFKDDATEVREGFECGIGVGNFKDIQIGDVFEAFEMREKKRA